MPVPTRPTSGRPASPDLPPTVLRSGSEGGPGKLVKLDPAYAFLGEMQAEKDPVPLPTATLSTTKMSRKAAASVQEPALKKVKPTEAGPTPSAPRSGPESSPPAKAGTASAAGGEVQAK